MFSFFAHTKIKFYMFTFVSLFYVVPLWIFIDVKKLSNTINFKSLQFHKWDMLSIFLIKLIYIYIFLLIDLPILTSTDVSVSKLLAWRLSSSDIIFNLFISFLNSCNSLIFASSCFFVSICFPVYNPGCLFCESPSCDWEDWSSQSFWLAAWKHPCGKISHKKQIRREKENIGF